MESKLQALLEKLQQDGVDKGKEVAAAIVHDAERQAEKILQEAKQEAESIRAQAKKEAEELHRNVTSELHLAAQQSVSALKQEIGSLINEKAISEPVGAIFSDQDFLRKTIDNLIDNWQQQGGQQSGISLLLPEGANQLMAYLQAKSQETLEGKLQIDFDGKLSQGFRIGPASENYHISFTEEDFKAFFLDYLRPRTRKLLFNDPS
jgi:V/A-type H+-transporting ATPase subunit E